MNVLSENMTLFFCSTDIQAYADFDDDNKQLTCSCPLV